MAADGFSTLAPAAQAHTDLLLLWPDPARRRTTLERAAERAAALLARLVDRLDIFDGDADLEPVNGAQMTGDQRFWAAGGDEGEREPDADLEPSLAGFGTFQPTNDLEAEFGGLGDRTNQRRWAEEHGDEGDGKVDDEPSLGSVTSCSQAGDQRGWNLGHANDAEDEHDGREPSEDTEPEQHYAVPSYGIDQRVPLGWGVA